MILNTRAFSRVRKIAKSDYSLRHICPSAWNNSASTTRVLMKFGNWGFLENLSRKFNFYWSPTRVTGILHKEHCTFIIISRWIFFRMRNVSYKSCRENQKIHFTFGNFSFRKSCRLWDNAEKYAKRRRGNTWQYNAAHALCVLDNYGYSHTLIMCNTYCFLKPIMLRHTYTACRVVDLITKLSAFMKPAEA
jgi:hypothetical protein